MPYNVTADLWYQYFMSEGPQWLILVAVFGLRTLWATIGMLFNFGVVYMTYKNKNVRGSCNILIALESFFGFILDMGFYVSFLVSVIGLKFIRYEHCFWIIIVPCICGSMAQFTMVTISIDRLIAVAFPIWFKNREINKRYVLFIVALIFSYGIFDLALRFIDYTYTTNIMVSCATYEVGQSFIGQILKSNGLMLSGTLMLTYFFCWLMVFKLPTTSESVDADNRKLIKALLFIIGFNLIGVFVRVSIDLLFQAYAVVNVFIRSPYSITFSFLTITVYSANGPMLYAISSEYRTRFNQQFPWLTKTFAGRLVIKTTTTTAENWKRANVS